jgi:hypothetical protein
MSFIQAVGGFNSRTTNGIQTISPPGFSGVTPKALILWCTMRPSTGIAQEGSYFSMGMGTGLSNQYCFFSGSQNGVGTTKCYSKYNSSNLLEIKSGDPTTGTYILVDFDPTAHFASGNFKIRWTNAPASAIKVQYMVFGGTDLNVKALPFLTPGSDSTPSFTGFGFQPSGLICMNTAGFAHASTVGLNYSFGLGATDGTTEHSFCTGSQGNVGTSNTNRIQTSRLMSFMLASGTERDRAAFSAFESDGFSAAFTNTTSAQYRFVTLAFEGVEMEVVTDTVKGSTGTKTTTTSFTPTSYLLGSSHNVVTSSVTNDNLVLIGAGSGTDSAENICAGVIDRTGRATTIAYEFDFGTSSNSTVRTYTSTSLARHVATTNSLSASGIELNYTAAVATAYELFFVAFGGPESNPVTVTPAAATVIAKTVDPTVQFETIIVPSAATAIAKTNGPFVLQPENVTPSPATAVASTVNPTVIIGLTITPAPASAIALTTGPIVVQNTIVSPNPATAVVGTTGPIIVSGATALRHRKAFVTVIRKKRVLI